MRRVRGVVLDVDGTLVDSNDAHARSWVEALAEQARRLRARMAVVANEQRYRALKDALVGTSIEAAAGPAAVIEAAARPAEWVMAAVVGLQAALAINGALVLLYAPLLWLATPVRDID